MYRMIIVDDLPIIVDGLMELFAGQPQLGLELHTAYSAQEALAILEKTHIHIVLSDIKMPGMEGIELLRSIRQSWPSCKVIFLTSYDDFHYVKSAISSGAFDYMLKEESDDSIVQAVVKAISQLDEEYDTKRKLYEAKMQKLQLKPEAMQHYLLPLLQGDRPWSSEEAQRRFDLWDTPLRTDAPVLMLVGRVDSWEGWRAAEHPVMRFAIQNIAAEYLQQDVELISMPFGASNLVWLLQAGRREEAPSAVPQEMAEDPVFAVVASRLESMQRTCADLMRLPVSFAVANAAEEWITLPATFSRLRSMLLSERGADRGIILIDRAKPEEKSDDPEPAAGKLYKSNAKKIALLRHYLEQGKQEEFNDTFRELMAAMEVSGAAGFYKLEVYHALASIFLSFFNARPDRHWLEGEELNRLTQVDPEMTTGQMARFFLKLTQTVFTYPEKKAAKSDHEVVLWLQGHIPGNLQEDLSLARLADWVQMNPSYLSRLFKQTTGMGLLEYIQQCRIDKAKELLAASEFKVYEIAEKVGYESRLSFVRMFKNQVGMTPQEYREL
ncbi:MAG: response regulator [Paenibacillaceae bacterium]|nr:response regulator [Paenibacillaceae bacterium]